MRFPFSSTSIEYEAALLSILINGSFDFDKMALEIFQWQATHNPVYQEYLSYLNTDIKSVNQIADIPFIPIECFKHQNIQTGNWTAEEHFRSSGTTGQTRSRHAVKSVAFYHNWSRFQFQQRFTLDEQTIILALLPNYLQQGDSSLVQMVNGFLPYAHPESGFFLDDFEELSQKLRKAQNHEYRVVLFGVSYALLDFADYYQERLSNVQVIETGGMKGRRTEMTRSALHAQLFSRWNCPIFSEYGMTELMSQAYTNNAGFFQPSQGMRVLPFELNDPHSLTKFGQTATLHIVDLANFHSCSFIATQDLGRVYADGTFEVIGRQDLSEHRGCNLMVA